MRENNFRNDYATAADAAGIGYYFSDGLETPTRYAGNESTDNIIVGKISSNAKIVDFNALLNFLKEIAPGDEMYDLPKNINEFTDEQGLTLARHFLANNLSIAALMCGAGVIEYKTHPFAHETQETYYNVIDRSALIQPQNPILSQIKENKTMNNRTYIIGDTQNVENFKTLVNEFEKQYEIDGIPYKLVVTGFRMNNDANFDDYKDFFRNFSSEMKGRGDGLNMVFLLEENDKSNTMTIKAPCSQYPSETIDIPLYVQQENDGSTTVIYDRPESHKPSRGAPIRMNASAEHKHNGATQYIDCMENTQYHFNGSMTGYDVGTPKLYFKGLALEQKRAYRDVEKSPIPLITSPDAEVTKFMQQFMPKIEKQTPEKRDYDAEIAEIFKRLGKQRLSTNKILGGTQENVIK
jgi:hypothetical protein